MKSVIHKHSFPMSPGKYQVELPNEHLILSVASQPASGLAMWYWCNPESPKNLHEFVLVETGKEAPDMFQGNSAYVGTAQEMVFGSLPYALHVIEILDDPVQ